MYKEIELQVIIKNPADVEKKIRDTKCDPRWAIQECFTPLEIFEIRHCLKSLSIFDYLNFSNFRECKISNGVYRKLNRKN